ncbi:MAG: AraC family transcriptional regulator [Telmatospirillum sp.]|nr:AraC family transcriptional regulator [Telmatospirillum sp.]
MTHGDARPGPEDGIEVGAGPTGLAALVRMIGRHAGEDGAHPTAIPRLFLHRESQPTPPAHLIYEPCVCFVASGRKQLLVGDEVYAYDPEHYLVVSVDIPVLARVADASSRDPLLCVRLELDPAVIGALMLDGRIPRADREQTGLALSVSRMTPDLVDACCRLMRLLDSPRDIPVLAPMIEREILYRLLLGEQTARMTQIAFADSRLQQINRAIALIKAGFREPICVTELASVAGMSRSALHHHFRSVTGQTPLQYQKQLRLQEARRLMLGQTMDAAMAGHLVGYESPSQFSREYRRLFGAPPLQDIAALRAFDARTDDGRAA